MQAVITPEIANEFRVFSDHELDGIASCYNRISADRGIDHAQMVQLFADMNEKITDDDAIRYIQGGDSNNDGFVNFVEFLRIFKSFREGSGGKLAANLNKNVNVITVESASGHHKYSQEEVSGYVNHINVLLAGDKDLESVLPINPDDDSYFKSHEDGLILCKIINMVKPGTIDERALAKGNKLNVYSASNNRELALNSAKSIGVSTLNIGSSDIRDGSIHLILGLTWQLVRLSLVKTVNLTHHPELYRLLKEGQTIEDLLRLSPEELLILWVNYHLARANSSRKMTNFSKDLCDSEILFTLLSQVDHACSTAGMKEPDLYKRAELMLQEAAKIGCRKFVTPKEIVNGNDRLNFCFIATIFNTRPGLEQLDEAELQALNDALFKSLGDNEERTYCLWMNSNGVEPFIVDLYHGIKNGNAILYMLEILKPGCVDPKKLNKGKLSKFSAVTNLDYALSIVKQHFEKSISIVNISGTDIYDGNKNLCKGLLWQMLRYDILKTLKAIGKDGARIKDEEILEYANSVTASAGVRIESFKDPLLKDSRPILTFIDCIKPGVVDWSIVDKGQTEQGLLNNAMYVLSIVRTIGGACYLLPEDIVQLNGKLILTVYGILMKVQYNK